MNTKMKKELFNEVLTGLAVAATFAAVAPVDAFAQLTASVSTAQAAIASPALQFVQMIAYGVGAVLVVAGIANAKKHADQPSSNPLGPAMGKLGAGAALLAAPKIVGMMAATGTAAIGGTAGQYSPSGMGF